ncbi:MAG: hypothetical protein V3T20_08035 [Gemmatimonadota bacterium]
MALPESCWVSLGNLLPLVDVFRTWAWNEKAPGGVPGADSF